MTITRRRLLTSVGRLAVASPFLPMLKAAANAPGPFQRPRNLLLVFHPNGLEPGWQSANANGQLVLGPTLQALEPFRDQLLVAHGLHAGIRNEVMAHGEGMTSLWTGALIARSEAYSAHPSVDQRIAERIGQGVPLRSLELGVQSQVGFGAGGNTGVMVYGPSGKLQPEDDPNAVFRRLFQGSLTPAEQQRVQTERRSVLDFIRGDLTAVRTVAGLEAKTKLDAHLDGLRQLETRLAELASLQCETAFTPHRLNGFQLQGHEHFTTLAGLQQDLAVLALTCGVTRVASLQLSNSGSDRKIPGVNPNQGLHAVMHAGTRSERLNVNRYFAGQVASLLAKLKAVRRADGATLLDETLVVWGTEMAVGNHLRDPVPFVIAGGSPTDGYFRLGTALNLASPHRTTRLLVSVLRAFGIDEVSSLGDLNDDLSVGLLPGASRVS